MILGDSLQVMASLGRARGICEARCSASTLTRPMEFASTLTSSGQPPAEMSVDDEMQSHMSRESPEQVKAFRDTWRDGIHSYLTYLRESPYRRTRIT